MIEVTETITLEEYVTRGIERDDGSPEECHVAVATALAKDMREAYALTRGDYLKLCAEAWDEYVAEATVDE